jgi:uncharacterized protein YndB with AHSA1/START domain
VTLPFLISPKGEQPVRLQGHFAASPARVFRAWTTARELEQWFGRDAAPMHFSVDARVGGSWSAQYDGPQGAKNTLKGVYLEVEPDRKLVFSWMHERVNPDGSVETTKESTVTVTFEPDGDGTQLGLLHEGIEREIARSNVGEGWSASFAALQSHLAA